MTLLGCYYSTNDALFISLFDDIDELEKICQHALITKRELFWIIEPSEKMVFKPLNKHYHTLVEENEVTPFCQRCTDRLRGMNDACKTCIFTPNDTFKEKKSINHDSIIHFLKTKGCYKVDKAHFKREVSLLNKKNSY